MQLHPLHKSLIIKINSPKTKIAISLIILFISAGVFIQCKTTKTDTRETQDLSGDPDEFDDAIKENSKELFDKGQAVFRFESFGDEVFWTDQLQLHKAIADEKHGGMGKGLSPKEALAAGNCLECRNRQYQIFHDEFVVDKYFRFDVSSDAADQSIIYAISSEKYGLKGILINAYGIYTEPVTNEMLNKLNIAE